MTIAAHPAAPANHRPLPRPRLTPKLLAALAARLTPRDRWLLAMLHQHRVLTTTHITRLAFGSPATAAHRLLTLYRLAATDRFRPWTPSGSAPWHWVLGPAGAAVLAAEHGLTTAEFGYRHDKTLAIAHTPALAHTLGVNDLFTALAHHARTHPHTDLLTWWPERRCAQLWGEHARPDGYGRWRHHHTEVDFFVEHDTGTEPLHRLVAKLDGYTRLAHTTGITTPVLFHLPSPRRETSLHHQLQPALTHHPQLPIATTTHQHHPADPVWLPAGQTGPRRTLTQLTPPDDRRPPGGQEMSPP